MEVGIYLAIFFAIIAADPSGKQRSAARAKRIAEYKKYPDPALQMKLNG